MLVMSVMCLVELVVRFESMGKLLVELKRLVVVRVFWCLS